MLGFPSKRPRPTAHLLHRISSKFSVFDTLTRLLNALVVPIHQCRGNPIAVKCMIDQHPTLTAKVTPQPSTIALSDIPPWHEGYRLLLEDTWRNNRVVLRGWVPRRGGWMEPVGIERPEYTAIGRETKIDDWACEIQDVEGLGASKSDLTGFDSLDSMVQRNSPEMIDEIAPAKLQTNLAHGEIRIIHQANTSDCFIRHDWDGRVFLSNSGGSHHFAAARLIARLLGQKVPLRGRLYQRGVNAAPVAALTRDYAMFVVTNDLLVMHAFSEAMEGYRAPWFSHKLPGQLGDVRAVLLPRQDERAMRVAQLLQSAGAANFCRLLADLASPPPARAA